MKEKDNKGRHRWVGGGLEHATVWPPVAAHDAHNASGASRDSRWRSWRRGVSGRSTLARDSSVGSSVVDNVCCKQRSDQRVSHGEQI
jgi:hypothetical protein